MLVEVGDMIYWLDDDGETDIGWIVFVERRKFAWSGEIENLIYVRWLFEDDTDHIWEQTIVENRYMTLFKGE